MRTLPPSEFFEREVRPILVERCQTCHGGEKTKAGLKLTSRAGILKGGDNGPAVIAGKPEESLLVDAVGYQGIIQMPPKGKLPEAEIATLTKWVSMGLPWPDSPAVTPAAAPDRPYEFTDEQRQFWSFQPVGNVKPPTVDNSSWAVNGIDRFILEGLEAKGLEPAPPADRRTLIRRVTFDLTGLPPTPEEVAAFVADERPDAYEQLVDRLLASPQYGERSARHWLDLVRYTDSFDARGVGGEMDCQDAWRYRDWVVDAFNRDLPYDQFVQAQIAGDILASQSPGAFDPGKIVATGMLAIGNWGGGDADKEKLLTDIADDQVDVVSRTFLGLTVACARCHDHKFDPIPTRDYYGLAGMFFSSHILPNVGPKTNGPPMLRIPLLSDADRQAREAHARRIKELEAALKDATERHYRSLAESLQPETARYILAAWEFRDQSSSTALADFAAERDLQAFALRRWLDFLGLGEPVLMTTPVSDVHGASGVLAWKGKADTPSVTANTTAEPLKLLTFTLPPRSISVHPGPTSGVVVGWTSPINGKVRISGFLSDGDPAGGDGVGWAIDLRKGQGRRELASGDLPNNGAQALAQGQSGDNLAAVAVEPGDRIELVVLPKNGHTCDTTRVDLVISSWDGSASWDLTRDVLDDLHAGNPHADRLGNAGVWRFADMDRVSRGSLPGAEPGSPLATLGKAFAVGTDREVLEKAAQDFAATFTQVDPKSPFWIDNPADESALPAKARASLAMLRDELTSLTQNPPPPVPMAQGAQEGGVPGSPQEGVHDVKVHIRGRYDRLGDIVPRHMPTILAGPEASQEPITEGSGRLELAALADPARPSLDGPRDGQPALAIPLRRGDRPHAEQFRQAGRAADAPRVARLARPPVR